MDKELQQLRNDVDGLKRILEINLAEMKRMQTDFVSVVETCTKLAERITKTTEGLATFIDTTNGRLEFLEIMRE